jgi:Rrf2 family protein
MRLEVTRKSDLAVKVLIALSGEPRRWKGSELAKIVESTSAFVPQVIAPLVARGWVRSDPGPTGGYTLVAPLTGINVLEVIEAVEGPTDTGQCVLSDRPCGAQEPCALHMAWASARTELLAALARTSVAELSDGNQPPC